MSLSRWLVTLSARGFFPFMICLALSCMNISVVGARAGDRLERWDTNAEGNADRVAHLDSKGRLRLLEVDTNGDGRMDTFQYYRDGVVVRVERDTDYDGHIDERDILKNGKVIEQEKFSPDGKRVSLLILDQQGNPIKWERDTTGDGHFDTTYKYEHGKLSLIKYDSTGDGNTDIWQYLKEGVPYKQERDQDGDGKVDQVIIYDKEGTPLKSTHDLDGDGRMETTRFYKGGKVSREEKDSNGDGKPDIIRLFENARLVCQRQDTNGDGRFDVIMHIRDGRVVLKEEDTDHSGRMDRFTQFDGQGKVSIVRELNERTNRPVRIAHFANGRMLDLKEWGTKGIVFTKFNRGKPVTQLIDKNRDGRWDEKIIFDQKGKIAKAIVDSNADGIMDLWQYYRVGELVRAEQDRNHDGKVDAWLEYMKGKIVATRLDRDGDGQIDTVVRFDDPRWSRVVEVLDKGGRVKEKDYFSGGKLRRREVFDISQGMPVLVEEYDEDEKIMLAREAEKGSRRLNLTWHYDKDGNVVLAERDTTGDGRVDTWYYYKEGRIFRVAEDRNRDGRPDLWETYDSAQRVVMRKEDVDFNGTPDIEKRY